MRPIFCAVALILLVGMTPDCPASADEANSSKALTDIIVFIPPESGAPADRVGAGTRALAVSEVPLLLLVPADGGVTTLEKPPLIWYVKEPFSGHMEAKLLGIGPGQVGVSKTMDGRFNEGFYALDLNRSNMSLQPGTIYEWSVTLLEGQSGTVVGQGSSYVERVDVSSAASQDEDFTATVSDLAAQGLWFDALEPLFSLDLSGRARLKEQELLDELARSAGLSVDW